MNSLPKRVNLATQITERLFDAIIQGELKPGERIIETKMAKQLGVGQSSFREALQALELQGLVTKNRGTFVTKLTLQDFEALSTVRVELEPMAASKACGRLTSKHIGQLESYLDEMDKARRRRDFIALVKNDIAFHQLIWAVPQVSSIKRMLNLVVSSLFAFSLSTLFRAFSNDLTSVEERFNREHEDHCRLLAVLKKGNPDEARRTFREVFQNYVQTTVDDAKAESLLGPWSQIHPEVRTYPAESAAR